METLFTDIHTNRHKQTHVCMIKLRTFVQEYVIIPVFLLAISTLFLLHGLSRYHQYLMKPSNASITMIAFCHNDFYLLPVCLTEMSSAQHDVNVYDISRLTAKWCAEIMIKFSTSHDSIAGMAFAKFYHESMISFCEMNHKYFWELSMELLSIMCDLGRLWWNLVGRNRDFPESGAGGLWLSTMS